LQIPSFVLAHTNIKDEKIWQFYLLLAGWACIYTVMNTSVILFLNETLGNIFLAGLALAIGSVFSMCFDGIFSYLQKVYPSRSLFLMSIIGMMIAVMFFLISVNAFIAFLAAIFFRISFDLCDITAVSYVLAKSLPAEYGQNLSYKQLAQGVGMIFGFLVSAVLLATSYFIGDTTAEAIDAAASIVHVEAQASQFISALFLMKVFLLFLLFALFFLAFLLFDRNVKNFSKAELLLSFQKLEAETIHGLQHTAMKVVKNVKDIPGMKKSEKNQIKLVSTENKKSFHKEEVFKELSSAMKSLLLTFQRKPRNNSLLWSMGVMGIFSYWDTFLATFLPIFFTEVLKEQNGWMQNIPGSLLMLLFILPVLGLLPIVAKWGDKYGRFYFMVFGLLITAFSTMIIGFANKQSLFIIILAGFGISFGYLFGMSTAKAQVASKLNEFLAVEKQESEIDSNASAGPIMLTDNIGNILGPLVGGGLIALFGFQGFFIFFSLLLFMLLAYTYKNSKKISGHSYVFQSPVKVVDSA
jgi:MFS family permease